MLRQGVEIVQKHYVTGVAWAAQMKRIMTDILRNPQDGPSLVYTDSRFIICFGYWCSMANHEKSDNHDLNKGVERRLWGTIVKRIFFQKSLRANRKQENRIWAPEDATEV